MRAWYDILGIGSRRGRGVAGFRSTDAQVRQLIDNEAAREFPPAAIVLAGFSQGGAVSLYSGLRYPQRLAGIIALSCYLPLAGELERRTRAGQ